MKTLKSYITLALSVLFLALSFYPCTDVYVSIDTTRNASWVQEKSYSDQETLDSCSPLCTCVCCAVSITVALALHILPIGTTHMMDDTPLSFKSFTQNSEKSIWQPPKIVS